MTDPSEAITDEASPVRAAFNAMREHGRHHAEEDYTDLCCVAAALAGAIPHLDAYKRGAAAERDRIRQLALRHDATARTCPDGADCGHGNFHPFGPFADLLREPS